MKKSIFGKLICLIFTFFAVGIIDVSAKSPDEIPNRSYVIGTHEYKPGTAMTSAKVMWAARTITGEDITIEDMIIYYKNSSGGWVNSSTGTLIPEGEVPTEFDIKYEDGISVAQKLIDAKLAAKVVLLDEFNDYDQGNYTSENWDLLEAAKSAGDEAISAATNLAGVELAKTNAINSLADIEVYSESLANAKVAAKAELELKLGDYVETDYTPENWWALTGSKVAGDGAVDAAITIEAVTLAKDTAINNMDNVETIAETLEAYKVTIKAELNLVLSSYNSEDYEGSNWVILTEYKNDGDTAIDEAIDLAAVDAAKQTAVDNMASVETIAQTLTAYKDAAKIALNGIIDGYNSADYILENWYILLDYKTAGDTAIDEAIDLEAVDVAKQTAIDNMASVETIAQTLALAKSDATTALNTALGTYTEGEYTPENWIILNEFKTDGDTAINEAVDLEAVDLAKTTALNGMAGVKTIAQTLDQAKIDAKAELDAELLLYNEANYTTENWDALTGFKTTGDTEIDEAADVEAVTLAKETAMNEMGEVETIVETLANAKVDAQLELTEALGTYVEGEYTPENWLILTGFKATGDSEIDEATDLAGVDLAKTTALDAMAGVEKIV